MSKSQTLYHMSTAYGSENYRLTFSYNRTIDTSATVKLSDERSAAAHRFVISLCEEQLREEMELPKHAAKAIAAPKPAPEQVQEADFEDESPF